MRISDGSTDVCSSDLCNNCGEAIHRRRQSSEKRQLDLNPSQHDAWGEFDRVAGDQAPLAPIERIQVGQRDRRFRPPNCQMRAVPLVGAELHGNLRSEEHTSELQSLMRISYAVFRLKQKTITLPATSITHI